MTMPLPADILTDKTILQVIPDLAAGGAERTTLEITEALVQSGAKAITISAGGRMVEELEKLGGTHIEHTSLPSKSPIEILKNRLWIEKLIAEHSVDIVHARSRAPAWSAYWAAKATGVHFVTTYHGTYNAKTPMKRWYNSVMARGEVVIANSAYISEHVALAYPEAANRIVTIPRGVDLIAFDRANISTERQQALIDQWFAGNKPEHPILLLPGRLTAWKGQLQAIEAMALIAQGNDTNWTLVLTGDAQGRVDYENQLKELIEKNNLKERILLVGHCTDMPAAMSICDAVLAPSQEAEAFGRVAAEAGALGLPTVVSDLGGQKETVIEGVTGYRVKPGNIPALSKAIRQVLSLDADKRQMMADKAQLHIRNGYSKASLQNATLGVYRSILE